MQKPMNHQGGGMKNSLFTGNDLEQDLAYQDKHPAESRLGKGGEEDGDRKETTRQRYREKGREKEKCKLRKHNRKWKQNRQMLCDSGLVRGRNPCGMKVCKNCRKIQRERGELYIYKERERKRESQEE